MSFAKGVDSPIVFFYFFTKAVVTTTIRLCLRPYDAVEIRLLLFNSHNHFSRSGRRMVVIYRPTELKTALFSLSFDTED